MSGSFFQSLTKIGVSFTLLLFVCLGCIGSKGFNKYTAESVDKTIKEKPMYKRFDSLCSEIPLPEDFKLLGKTGLYNIKGILYYYDSKTNRAEVEKHFKDYFFDKGWKTRRAKSISHGDDFTDGKYRVGINYYADSADYTIYCGLLEKIDRQATWNEK